MRKLTIALSLLIAASAYAADPADEVRKAEIGFAKAFADRDQAKFFAYVADDAHFLSARRTMNNKAEVKEVWTSYFKDATPPFRWEPDRVVVNARGDLGLSTGPIHDAEGKHIGNYSSIWQRQKNGAWRVIFDGPGAPVCEEKK
jgi:ketosteroid isomerase-like protein